MGGGWGDGGGDSGTGGRGGGEGGGEIGRVRPYTLLYRDTLVEPKLLNTNSVMYGDRATLPGWHAKVTVGPTASPFLSENFAQNVALFQYPWVTKPASFVGPRCM